MRNLIHAEFYRYKRNGLIWLLLGAAFLSGVIFGLSVIINGTFDDMFIIPLSVILAVFLSLEVGQEYNDGTIRNKIVAGHGRGEIYISKFVMAVVTSLIMTTVYLVPSVILSAFVLWNNLQMTSFLCILFGFYILNFVWAVVFTFVSLLISKREVSAIVNFTLVIVVMLAAYQIEAMLGQPETYQNYEYISIEMTPEEVSQVKDGSFTGSYSIQTDDDDTITYYKEVVSDTDVEASKNPRYVEQPWRSVLSIIDTVLPNGQINLYVEYLTDVKYISDMELEADFDDSDYSIIYTYPFYSLVTVIVISGIGLMIFRKKEFK
ncbi:MAG: ABC transporter permease [Lachnospiraceae bacterium]|nr:ABC transporter permease [Lachnospiraceae bacterium]